MEDKTQDINALSPSGASFMENLHKLIHASHKTATSSTNGWEARWVGSSYDFVGYVAGITLRRDTFILSPMPHSGKTVDRESDRVPLQLR